MVNRHPSGREGDLENNQGMVTIDEDQDTVALSLDLSCLPPIYVLATHLSINEQHAAEDALSGRAAPLTYDIKEARIVLGNISKVQRARSELRWKGLRFEEVDTVKINPTSSSVGFVRVKKKRKVAHNVGNTVKHAVITNDDDSSTASGTADEAKTNAKPLSQSSMSETLSSPIVSSRTPKETGELLLPFDSGFFSGRMIVLKLEWLYASINADNILPLEPFTILNARLLPGEDVEHIARTTPQPIISGSVKHFAVLDDGIVEEHAHPKTILERAKADATSFLPKYRKRDRVANAAKQDIVGKSFTSATLAADGRHIARPPQLLHQTTSENDEVSNGALPKMPDWVLQNKIYSCERSSPLESPNEDFISLLKKIRIARILTLDEIGVRAYSTSIASLAAYPHRVQNSREVLALPGCDAKIGHLFHEYETNNHRIQAVIDLEADPAQIVLREFYEIWGVGAVTAREFYYDKGWRDLDDIIEHGWKSLSRVQQIGLKYYDELKLKLTRAQVEDIADTITRHAKLITDSNMQTAIVGGYRRGKAESSDVDVILSHPNEAYTQDLVSKVVTSLEREGWITHTLTLNTTNSKRNQEPLPINTGTPTGHGFDTLDKALVVWQDPSWPSKKADLAADPKAKNPNPHRRVDIITSPWRTVGCAVSGWTSGTTFQRDLRRYCKKVKGWKFDSSGVRERGTGHWIDLEGYRDVRTRCQTWQGAEKRVFAGLGLQWREPWERCTG